MTPQQIWFDLPVPGSARSRAGSSRRRVRVRLPGIFAFAVAVVGLLLISGLVELVG